jgi:hypothetical protein
MKLLSWLDLGAVFCFYEHGNDHLCFFESIQYLDHATNRQFFKDDSELWS